MSLCHPKRGKKYLRQSSPIPIPTIHRTLNPPVHTPPRNEISSPSVKKCETYAMPREIAEWQCGNCYVINSKNNGRCSACHTGRSSQFANGKNKNKTKNQRQTKKLNKLKKQFEKEKNQKQVQLQQEHKFNQEQDMGYNSINFGGVNNGNYNDSNNRNGVYNRRDRPYNDRGFNDLDKNGRFNDNNYRQSGLNNIYGDNGRKTNYKKYVTKSREDAGDISSVSTIFSDDSDNDDVISNPFTTVSTSTTIANDPSYASNPSDTSQELSQYHIVPPIHHRHPKPYLQSVASQSLPPLPHPSLSAHQSHHSQQPQHVSAPSPHLTISALNDHDHQSRHSQNRYNKIQNRIHKRPPVHRFNEYDNPNFSPHRFAPSITDQTRARGSYNNAPPPDLSESPTKKQCTTFRVGDNACFKGRLVQIVNKRWKYGTFVYTVRFVEDDREQKVTRDQLSHYANHQHRNSYYSNNTMLRKHEHFAFGIKQQSLANYLKNGRKSMGIGKRSNSWYAQVNLNGANDNDSNLRLSLTLLGLPPLIKLIKVHVIFRCNYNDIKYQTDFKFNYDNKVVSWPSDLFLNAWIYQLFAEYQEGLTFAVDIQILKVYDMNNKKIPSSQWCKYGIFTNNTQERPIFDDDIINKPYSALNQRLSRTASVYISNSPPAESTSDIKVETLTRNIDSDHKKQLQGMKQNYDFGTNEFTMINDINGYLSLYPENIHTQNRRIKHEHSNCDDDQQYKNTELAIKKGLENHIALFSYN